MNEAQRVQFEKWVRDNPGIPIHFIGWQAAYAAGAAAENKACAILCENAENCSGELLHHDCHEQDAKAIRARQEQEKERP